MGPAFAVIGSRVLLVGQLVIPTAFVLADVAAGRNPLKTGVLNDPTGFGTAVTFIGGALIATRSATVPRLLAVLAALGAAMPVDNPGTHLLWLNAGWLFVSLAAWDVLRAARSLGRHAALAAVAFDGFNLLWTAPMVLSHGAWPSQDLWRALMSVSGLVHLPRLAAFGFLAVRRAAAAEGSP